MQKQQVLHNQSLLDFALHHYGKIEALFDLTLINGISATDVLTPGAMLETSETIDKSEDIVNFYTYKSIVPASGLVGNLLPEALTGIGYMVIQNDFKVG